MIKCMHERNTTVKILPKPTGSNLTWLHSGSSTKLEYDNNSKLFF
jgi:hypothetical protein